MAELVSFALAEVLSELRLTLLDCGETICLGTQAI